MKRKEQIDIASILLRVLQIDFEKEPEHWLWDRIITCDVPRLRDYITDEDLEHKFAEVLEDIQRGRGIPQNRNQEKITGIAGSSPGDLHSDAVG